MPERDPKCVLSVAEEKAAELLAAWLTEKGFPAEPVSLPPSTSEDPITHAAIPVPGEFQVWVKNLDHSKEAQELIELQRAGVQAVREREAKRATATGNITAVCEDCGKESEWPGSRIGMTEICPHCHSYMDIPDPDEVWDEDEIMAQDADAEQEPDRAD
jgi:hypothetical protein